MHIKNNFSFPVALSLLALSWISCKKFISIDPPPTQIESIKIFANEQSAVSAVTGLYSMMGLSNLNFINGGITLYAGAAADELLASAPNTDLDAFSTNSIPVTHSNLFNRLWRGAYNNNCIYTANAILAALPASASLPDSLRNQLSGEVMVIRSLAYFHLVNLFGDVPFARTPDFTVNSLLARTPVSIILPAIKEDLILAFSQLSAAYPTANRARINQWTAAALLARLCLYTEDWTGASFYSSQVIHSGTYQLSVSLPNVFTSTSSPETIWQLVRDNAPTAEGTVFNPSSATARPNYVLSPLLLNAFPQGDLRKSAWVAKNTVAGLDYFYPYKYRSRTPSQPAEYAIQFRLAEQYLIRAEARVHLNDLAGAAADLNKIRNRAGLPNTTAAGALGLQSAILAERQLELFCESGHRWFDLKRTGNADAVLAPIKGSNWQSTDRLFPIPQAELDKNPFLIQNLGY